jgi:hypothetical protein
MKKLAIVFLALAVLGGCGSSTEELWGGYTEGEVKDILSDPQFREEIMRTAPPDPRGPIQLLYPSDQEIEDADLTKVTVQGEENWEYRDEETDWCINIRKNPQTGDPETYVGGCISD